MASSGWVHVLALPVLVMLIGGGIPALVVAGTVAIVIVPPSTIGRPLVELALSHAASAHATAWALVKLSGATAAEAARPTGAHTASAAIGKAGCWERA